MENKNCLVCGNTFPINTKGDEQKYCSHSCRYKAANERRINKIKEQAITNAGYQNSQNNIQSQPSGNISIPFGIEQYIEQVKETERAKAESQIAQIKFENQIKEKELLDRILRIEQQIKQEDDEEDEDDENKSLGSVDSGGWIGAIFNSEFGKELARNPKTSEILGSLASLLMKAS